MNISTQFNYWQKKFLILIFFVLLLPAYVFAHGDDGHVFAATRGYSPGFGDSADEAFRNHINLNEGMGNCVPNYREESVPQTTYIWENGLLTSRIESYFISDGYGNPDRKTHDNGVFCSTLYIAGGESDQGSIVHYVCPEGKMIHDFEFSNGWHTCEITEPEPEPEPEEPKINPKTSPSNCESS